MSSCFSSRTCGFDLEHMVKWPCNTFSRTSSNSSSPSSTLSESGNSPVTITARKHRSPRKRPNQTYNEAAALLSMACPNIFSTKNLTKRNRNPPKLSNFFNEPPESELILQIPVIENSGFLLRQRITEKPCSLIEPKVANSCQEIESNCVSVELSDGCLDDFDTESMLDEEMEQGIDSIMGDSNSIVENDELNDIIASDFNACYRNSMVGFGMRALRNSDGRNWWSFPMVDVVNISPATVTKSEKSPVGKKKKTKKKKMEELMKSERDEQRLMLKLDYDGVLNAWSSDKGLPLPLPEEISQSASPGGDIHAIAARIDLFSENDGSS